MRFVTYRIGDDPVSYPGVVDGLEIVDLRDYGSSLIALLELGQLIDIGVRALSSGAHRVPIEAAILDSPIPDPPKVLGIGMNYAAHVAEMGREIPQYQYWFNKQSSCVTGARQPIEIPPFSEQVDYEGELAMIIGRRCRNVPAARFREVVAGYTVMNDVSVRDWQWRTPTFTMGKSYDTHGPAGPWLVTTDEIPDPNQLRLQTWVNGELRQDSTTADMIFDCGQQIEYLSEVFWLEPGDIITTGTPAGVGANSTPPRWLRAGDRVTIEVEGIGVLENNVVAAAAPTVVGLDDLG